MPNFLPLSWAAGMAQALIWPLFCNTVVIMLPQDMPTPVTPEYVHRISNFLLQELDGKKKGIVLTPNTIRDLSRSPSLLQALSTYSWLGYAGAPLDQPTGDLISKYTRVQSLNGSTDIGVYPLLLNDPADWNVHRLHPNMHGFYFQHFVDDLYEMCARRIKDEYRHCFVSEYGAAREQSVFHTRDLWRAVKGRPDFFETAGRVDDFVKLSSMTKFNAITIEQILDRHPDIQASVVAGDGRPKPFVIIEPSISLRQSAAAGDEQIERAKILNTIWPAFEDANRTLYAEAQLVRELVLITDAETPIPRTAKGTVKRREALATNEAVVEALYSVIPGSA